MEPNKKNILLISYFFFPDKRVGALRASYWSKELPNAMNANVVVMTANEEAENAIVIPVEGTISKLSPIKDEGAIWKHNVKNYCEQNSITKPDVVIITGSPFMHFGLASFFKQKYGSKVILDYRDPFANNPGFDNGKLKIAGKKYFERKFNKNADALVTVNDYCGGLIEGFDKKPHAIIQNGFDETVEPKLKSVEIANASFSYTGKFYFDPSPILDAMVDTHSDIHVVGPDAVPASYSDKKNIYAHGFVTYPEAVQLVANNDVGIIQTYGEDFQSTTKIFDYVRCGRVILIVSNLHVQRGSIHEELKGYPNVFWARNDKTEIAKTIERIKSSDFVIPSPTFGDKFSRKNQMTKLIDLIEKIA